MMRGLVLDQRFFLVPHLSIRTFANGCLAEKRPVLVKGPNVPKTTKIGCGMKIVSC
jgi:hypothetical protein